MTIEVMRRAVEALKKADRMLAGAVNRQVIEDLEAAIAQLDEAEPECWMDANGTIRAIYEIPSHPPPYRLLYQLPVEA